MKRRQLKPFARWRVARLWPVSAMLLFLAACSGDPGTGPQEVRWDRYTCERCRMVLSDRKHSAQVRFREPTGKSRVRFFDDIGCAILWLEDKPFRDAHDTEIWVTDWRSGEWIDARSAHYLKGQVTPMEYGLGAQSDPDPDSFDYRVAREQVFDVERRFNVHGTHLEPPQAGR